MKVNTSEEVGAVHGEVFLKCASAIYRQMFFVAYDCIVASYFSGIVRLQGDGEKYLALVIDTKDKLGISAATERRACGHGERKR
jgi:hypothetical protein